MTDEINGAVDAAPDASPVLEAAIEAAEVPAASEPAEAPAEKPRSARDAVREALSRTDERPRGPDGRFQPRDGETPEAPVEAQETPKAPEAPKADDEPPARFSADAKAAWRDAPPAVKAEIRRALAENEKGIKEYQDRFEPLKRFDDMAKRSGTTMADAMERYIGFEQMIRRDPIRGLDAVARNIGTSLEDVARHVLGQQQAEPAKDDMITALRQEIDGLKQQLGGVTQTIHTQQASSIQQQIGAVRGEMPRFDELEASMAQLINSGIAQGDDAQALIRDAYLKAERLTPPPAPVAPPPPPPMLSAQTRPLSVQGAPASGSNPATRQPSPNARSAVARALAQVQRRA